MSLESSLDSVKEELQSAHRRLGLEDRWRGSADGIHTALLAEKTQLQAK